MPQLQAPLVSCKPLLGTCCRFASGASSLPLTLRAGPQNATPDGDAPVLVAVAGRSRSDSRARHRERECSPSRASLQLAAPQPRARRSQRQRQPFTSAVPACPERAPFQQAMNEPACRSRRCCSLPVGFALGSIAGAAEPRMCAQHWGSAARGSTFTSASQAEAFDPGLSADKRVCPSSKRPSSAASPRWAPAAALHPVTPRCR